MGPFQKMMNDLNLILVTAGPRGEFSSNVCKWIEDLSSKYADTKCDDGRDKETRALIMASVRNDCYRELHYSSIYGEATNVLESLQFHCSKQSGNTLKHLTDKDAAPVQSGPGTIGNIHSNEDDSGDDSLLQVGVLGCNTLAS